MSDRETIYVKIVDEHFDAFRPVSAEQVSPMIYRLLGPVPDDETWEFQPGELVRCEDRVFTGGNRGFSRNRVFWASLK